MFREERRLLLEVGSFGCRDYILHTSEAPTTLLDELDTGKVSQDQFTKRTQQLETCMCPVSAGKYVKTVNGLGGKRRNNTRTVGVSAPPSHSGW